MGMGSKGNDNLLMRVMLCNEGAMASSKVREIFCTVSEMGKAF